MKKANVIILGLIVLISLGITANLLFGSNESNGQVDEDSSLVTEINEPETDDELNENNNETIEEPDNQEESSNESSQESIPEEEIEQEESNTSTSETELEDTESDELEDQSEQSSANETDSTTSENQSSERQASNSTQESSSETSENEQPVEDSPNEDTNNEDVDNDDTTEEEYQEDTSTEVVSLIIDARQDGGNSYLGEVEYEQGDTALAALIKFASERGLSVELAEDNNGDILEIDGHTSSEDSGQWILYINGYRAVNNAGANKIAPDTTVRYHYIINHVDE